MYSLELQCLFDSPSMRNIKSYTIINVFPYYSRLRVKGKIKCEQQISYGNPQIWNKLSSMPDILLPTKREKRNNPFNTLVPSVRFMLFDFWPYFLVFLVFLLVLCTAYWFSSHLLLSRQLRRNDRMSFMLAYDFIHDVFKVLQWFTPLMYFSPLMSQ